MNKLKTVSLLILISGLFLPNALKASTQKATAPSVEEEQKKPTVPQKVGKESGKAVKQVKKAGKDLGSAFKKELRKDKKK